MTADQPLPDVWFTRDLPVLRAIARLVDAPEHGGSPYLLGAVVPASGLPKADVIVAAKALPSQEASYRNLHLNTGHGTLGWTMAAGSGRMLADLISGHRPEIKSDDLGYARYLRRKPLPLAAVPQAA